MTERVGELGSLQTEFQNIKKLDNRIEAVAKVTEGLEKKAVNQNLAKEVATFTKRLVSLEEDMAQQASNLKPDTYYEDMVTGIVAAITEKQVKNVQSDIEQESKNRFTHMTTITQRITTLENNLQEEHTEDTKGSNDVLVTEIASNTEKIAKIQKDLRKNYQQTYNLGAFSHLLALMIESLPHNFERLVPTLKVYRKIITVPWIIKKVPDLQDIGRYFDDKMCDIIHS